MTLDQAGNLYGTASSGGGVTNNNGTVYELLRPHGARVLSMLYTFKGGSDGYDPFGGVTFDKAGNLYGTTFNGRGSAGGSGAGIVYRLAPAPSGPWSETVLQRFGPSPTNDGAQPSAGVTRDAAGNLYGTATQGIGGCYGLGCGMVFEVTL